MVRQVVDAVPPLSSLLKVRDAYFAIEPCSSSVSFAPLFCRKTLFLRLAHTDGDEFHGIFNSNDEIISSYFSIKENILKGSYPPRRES